MAAASLLGRIHVAIRKFELAVGTLLGRGSPPESLGLAWSGIDGLSPGPADRRPQSKFNLKDVLGDGFLWAVPKSRRSLERRLQRKYGDPYYVYKLLLPKTTLRTCNACGSDHEVGRMCPTCYKKVIEETKEMQEVIEGELKLKPVEKEVVVMYEGEKTDCPPEFFQGKRIVEMKKSRPAWFSKNLLQQTTQQPSDSKDVKPSGLS